MRYVVHTAYLIERMFRNEIKKKGQQLQHFTIDIDAKENVTSKLHIELTYSHRR